MLQLRDVQNLLEESKPKDALIALQAWASVHFPERTGDITLQLARVNGSIQSFTKGLVTMKEYNAEQLNIIKAVFILLEECQKNSTKETASTVALHEYHAYTCDRIDHSDAFKQAFQTSPENPQYFFLYGGDMQSHEGFFRRTAYDLEGRLQDYLNAEVVHSTKAIPLEMTFEASRQIDIYKQNVLKSFFSMFGLSANEHQPLLEKDFTYVLEKSPRTKGLGEKDFICIYIHISEYDWDAELTPEAARWLINSFCKNALPENAPSVLMFFALEYDEDDEQIRSEINTAIEESENVKALPELNMVLRRDIGQWLERYKQVAVNTKARKQILKTVFGQTNEHYMEDIEIELKRIIDQHNELI